MEAKGIGLDTMALEHLSDNLRHRQLLENSLVVAELQVIQRWHQRQVIAGQAGTGLLHPNVFDTAMQPFPVQTEAQKRRLAEQALKIEVGVLADQFNVDRVQGANGYRGVKRQDLEVVTNRRDQKFELHAIGRCKHRLVLKRSVKKHGHTHDQPKA
ncbi:hypothetical protein D3C81_1370270 [compost metagenome]